MLKVKLMIVNETGKKVEEFESYFKSEKRINKLC